LGNCVNGQCLCRPGFEGEDCSQLKLNASLQSRSSSPSAPTASNEAMLDHGENSFAVFSMALLLCFTLL
jgi:hypothetical protein